MISTQMINDTTLNEDENDTVELLGDHFDYDLELTRFIHFPRIVQDLF